MNQDKKYKTVNMPLSLIKKIYESEDGIVNVSNIHSWVNIIIENVVSKSLYLQKTAPQLSLAANSSNGIIIRDKTMPKNELAEVVFQAQKLFCETCGVNQCGHIDFVRTTSEFGKMIREKLQIN